MNALRAAHAAAAKELETFMEEQATTATGDDGPLTIVGSANGRVTTGIRARLEAVGRNAMDPEERQALERWIALIESETEARKLFRAAQGKLDRQVLARYDTLTDPELKAVVVDDKWLAAIKNATVGENRRVMRQFVERLRKLQQRYDAALPEIQRDVDALAMIVHDHLQRMGISA